MDEPVRAGRKRTAPNSSGDGVDPSVRAAAVATVAGALWASWIAFTLGAYHVIFFDQILAVWAASLGVFVITLSTRNPAGLPVLQRLALLIPSIWVVAALVLPIDALGPDGVWLWINVAITLAGLPYLGLILLEVFQPGLLGALPRSTLWAVVASVLVVAIAAFGLGRLNYRLMTCEDFVVSGNARPTNCHSVTDHR